MSYSYYLFEDPFNSTEIHFNPTQFSLFSDKIG